MELAPLVPPVGPGMTPSCFHSKLPGTNPLESPPMGRGMDEEALGCPPGLLLKHNHSARVCDGHEQAEE